MSIYCVRYSKLFPTEDNFLCGAYLPLSMSKLACDSIIQFGSKEERESLKKIAPKVNPLMTHYYGLVRSRSIEVDK